MLQLANLWSIVVTLFILHEWQKLLSSRLPLDFQLIDPDN
jgi:hypothetical protein